MFHRFVSMLILPAALLLGGFSVALAQQPTALVQIIHNAADPGAAVVDVYLGDTKAVDDFAFRTATPFLILPANTDLTVGVAPGNSMSSADVIAPFTVNLAPGRYVAVANGVLNPANFAANADPAAAPIAFDLYSIDSISDTAADDATVDFVIFHGVTDAPAVDVRTGGTALVESLSYGEATTTLSVPADSYILDVAPAGGETLVSYTADVSTLGGSSLTVVASGFLDPAANQDGPAFGLWAAFAAGGDLVELPVYTAPTTAMVQIIHNAADPGAAVVDVYLGDTKAVDDFAFRTATPFIELPVNTDLTVGVAGPNSESVADVLASFDVNLAPGRYVIVANGVLNPDNFAANADPAAAPIAFNLYAIDGISEAADDDATVDVVIFHGVTDAPAVDVRTGGTALVESLSYGASTATLSVPADNYILDIAPAGGETLVSYTADVSTLGGASLTVVASGFLDPTTNQNGPAFGLWAATAAGGALLELPVYTEPTTAMVQIIHNAADPGAAVVDVYLGDTKVIDDFAFRTATPFIELPVNTDLTVGVAGPNSESVADVLASFDVNLAPGRYVIIAKGVLNPANFAANADPDAAPIGFSLYAIRGISEAADDDATVDVVIFHGVTDAPAVDVRTGGTTLVESLSYGAASATLSVPAKSYILDIAPAGGATLVSYTADVSALGGASLTVVASGFLDPTANQNGPAFGLWAATAAGGALIELPPVTVSVEEELAASANVSVQPNPATSGAELLFTMPVASEATVTVVSTMGSVVLERALGMLPAGDHRFWLDATQVGSGQHYVTISAGTLRTTLPFTIVR